MKPGRSIVQATRNAPRPPVGREGRLGGTGDGQGQAPSLNVGQRGASDAGHVAQEPVRTAVGRWACPRCGEAYILTAPGDIIYCGFVGAEGIRGHYADGDFGDAFCRISRKVLEAMPPPWFRFPTNATGTVRTSCECAWFHACAKPIWPIRMVGIVGHLQRAALLLTPTLLPLRA